MMAIMVLLLAFRSDAYWLDGDSRCNLGVTTKNRRHPRLCTVLASTFPTPTNPTNPLGTGRIDDETLTIHIGGASTSKTKTWRVEGLKCGGCVERVRNALSTLLDDQTSVQLDPPVLEISDKWSEDEINNVLARQATEQHHYRVYSVDLSSEATGGDWGALAASSWSANHKEPLLRVHAPLIGVFASLLAAAGLVQVGSSPFSPSLACRHFMGGWFVIFSCMKLINLPVFVDAFEQYDLLARRWRIYGFVYPFIELTLGMVYLGFGSWINPQAGFISLPFGVGLITTHRALWQLVNLVTLVVMGMSGVGVAKALRDGKQLVCACLGGGRVKLPMSYVSLAEDVVMALMALVALFSPSSMRR